MEEAGKNTNHLTESCSRPSEWSGVEWRGVRLRSSFSFPFIFEAKRVNFLHVCFSPIIIDDKLVTKYSTTHLGIKFLPTSYKTIKYL